MPHVPIPIDVAVTDTTLERPYNATRTSGNTNRCGCYKYVQLERPHRSTVVVMAIPYADIINIRRNVKLPDRTRQH